MNNVDDIATQAIVAAWREFLAGSDWQKLIEGVEPKQTGCGPVYELPNYLKRPNESFAIADMREGKLAEPHYHPDEDVEIYVVLEGNALVVVGGTERQVTVGDVVVIPPNEAHFTLPKPGFVIALINTPPFRVDHHIVIDPGISDPAHKFDVEQFKKLTT